MAEKRKPVFIARAKETPDNDRWMSIGAVWNFKEGDGYAVRLNCLPTNWDGTMILVAPKDNGNE